MSNKRIDLTQFEGMTKGLWKHRDMSNEKQTEWDLWSYDENGDPQVWLAQLGYYQRGGHSDAQDWERLHATWRAMSATPDLIAELKKMYKREDELLEALRIIRDDLDEAIAQGNLPITSTNGIDATKIRNFANDASQ